MLRITAHDDPRVLTFLLEGRLEGSMVCELETCWQNILAIPTPPILRVDLSGVTFVDDAGKARLAAMYRQGAEFIAADCLMKSVVDEISGPETPSDDEPDVGRETN